MWFEFELIAKLKLEIVSAKFVLQGGIFSLFYRTTKGMFFMPLNASQKMNIQCLFIIRQKGWIFDIIILSPQLKEWILDDMIFSPIEGIDILWYNILPPG